MLEARNIHVNYGHRKVVEDITLRCDRANISVIGPNGAGKSTLLQSKWGLNPLARRDLLTEYHCIQLARRAIARRIATVAQDADVRFPVTVLEFILGGRYAWSNAGAWGWESDDDGANRDQPSVKRSLMGLKPG